MSHRIERKWITEAGLAAACLVMVSNGRDRHRCGYVAVPAGHPLHGTEYGEEHPALREIADQATLGLKSPILLLTAACDSSRDGAVRCSPDIAFDVHGGLTYSGDGYFSEDRGSWWFGFDCAHCDDGPMEEHPDFYHGGVVRSEQYVVSECERLAKQIVAAFPEAAR